MVTKTPPRGYAWQPDQIKGAIPGYTLFNQKPVNNPYGWVNAGNTSVQVSREFWNNPVTQQILKQHNLTLYKPQMPDETWALAKAGRPFWTPRRIGRYYQALKSLPDETATPAWIDLPSLNAAYQYLSETRQTDWQNWEDSVDQDPALAEFVSTWAPPPIEAIPDWEQQQLEQEYNLQQQYQPGAVEPVGEWTKYGIDKAAWDKLPEWKKLANRVFRSREGMMATSAAQFALPFILTGQPVGVAISAPLGAGFGYAMQKEGERAAALGEAYKPGLWYYVGGAFNWAYQQSQQALGFTSQIINAIKDPEQYGELQEILKNIPAAWEAGEGYYALAAMKMLADQARAAEEGKPVGQYPALEMAIEEAAARGEYEYTEEQKKLQRELEEHKGEMRIVNIAGEDVWMPIPESKAIVGPELTDIRRMLIGGQLSSAQVRDYVFSKYGFTTELADLVAGLALDPLNVMPNIEVPAIRAVAKATGNVSLQRAATDVPDLQQLSWKYRQIIRTEMSPDDITKLSNLTRTFASVTKEGGDVLLEQPKSWKQNIVHWAFGLTAEARAVEIQHQFIQGLAMLLETERNNPDGIMRLLNTFAGKPEDVINAVQNGKIKITVGGKLTEVDMPRWFLSAEGQSVPLMMKDIMPSVKDHYDAWRNSRPQAEWLQRIADGLEMDVYKLKQEIHEGRLTFDQIVKQLDELEAQGRQPAKLLKQSLAKVRDLNNHALKQMADLFTGKDGLPFGADQWTVHLWNILAEGADNWAVKWFNIKPSNWATRLAQVNKQAMSMMLLGVNPTYLLNNAINNVVTMMWDGMLGSMSKRTRSAYMRRFGISTKIHKAYNQAEIGEIEPGRVEMLGARDRGYEIGKGVRAAKRNKDLLQMSSDLLHRGDKFMLAATLSRKTEKWSSEMATVKGIMEYMDRTWRPGVGYDKIPDDLRVILDGVQPGLADRVETAIARGLNRQEIEAEIFNRLDTPTLRDVLSPDEMATLDHFPGLVDEINASVREAKTPEEVRAVFDNAIEKVNKEIGADLQRKITALVHKSAVKAQIEGLAGVFDMMDQLVPERHDFWMEHLRKMDEAAQEAAKLTGLERANVWRRALEQADAEWRNFQNLEGAKWLGIVEGLGFEKMSPEYGQMTKNLEDVHDMWNNFYGLRRDLMDEYWGYIDTTDFSGMSKAEADAMRSAKWAEINERLNEAYADHVITEDAYQVAMDEQLVRLYRERVGEASGNIAARWREAQLLTRRIMAEAHVVWRVGELPESITKVLGNVLPKEVADKIRLLNNGEPIYRMPVGQRDAANQKFYRQIYQPLIAAMMDYANRQTVPQPKPKPPKVEEPRAEPVEVLKIEEPKGKPKKAEKNPLDAEINRLLAEKKPEIKQVTEAGVPDIDYRLNVIKWLRRYSPAARQNNVKKWIDVTPALILDAWQNEQYFLKHQAELPGVEAPKETGEVAPETRPEEPEVTRVEEATPEAESKPIPAQELSPENKWRRLVNESGKYNQIEKRFYTDAILPTESSRDVVLATINRLLGELPEQNVKYIDTEGNYRIERGYGAEWYWKEYDALAEKLKQLRADRIIRSSELKRAKKEARREALKSFDDAIRETKNEMARLHSDYKEALEWLRDSIKLGRLLNISRSDRVNEFRVGVMKRVIEDSIWPTETYIPPGTPEHELAYLPFMLDIGRYNQVVDMLAEGGVFTTWGYADFERNGISRVQADYLVDLWLKKISELNDAELRAVIVGEIEPTRGVPPEIQSEIERVRRANRAKERVIEQATAMRQNADEILQLAPPKEVNGEIYREWLHNHFADRYPDKPQIAAERADTTFAVIDRIVENKARELGITKDEFYKNFVLTRGGEGMGGTALHRADPERFYASLDRLEYERFDDGIYYALYSKDGLEQSATVDYAEARTLLGDDITAHILAESVAGIIKGDMLRTIPEGSFKVMPSERVGALTYWLSNGRAVIHAFKRADVPDMLHEFVHAVTPLLPDGDLATIKNWYEAEYGRTLREDWYSKANVDRDAFEKLARGFERYMTEGPKGFTGAIADALAKIKRWMLDTYMSLTHPDINIRLNDDIRAMFDRWLGEEPKPEGEAVTAPPSQPAPDIWKRRGEEGGAGVLYRTQSITDTPEFRAWFGDSKVVDTEGNPKIVYHGTNVDFEVFEKTSDWLGFHFGEERAAKKVKKSTGKKGEWKIGQYYLSIQNPLELPDLGNWRTFDLVPALKDKGIIPKDMAWTEIRDMARERVNAERPDLLQKLNEGRTPENKLTQEQWDDINAEYAKLVDKDQRDIVVEFIEKSGHDGIVYYNEYEGGLSYIAFRPEQIKSVENVGTFSPSSANILYRKPNDPDGGDLPEPPVNGAPIGTGEELTGLPMEEITLEGWTKEVRPMLERARRAMLERPKLGIDIANDLPNEAQTRLRQYLGQVYSQLADTKIGAAKWGETRRQFALLDYTKQTGAEAATFSLLPYGFWYTHTAINWALRALNRPAIMANYFRLMRMQQRHTEGDGFPARLRNKTFIPLPFTRDWMGGGMWVDPYRQVFPFEQIAAPFRRASEEQNQENRRTEQIIYDWVESGEIGDEEAQAAIETREGPLWVRAHSQALDEIEQDFQNPFDYVFALTAPLLPLNWAYNAMTGRADRIGQLPFTRLVQTMTAAAGIGGPRGVNLEAPIRRWLGLPEVSNVEDYLVERELSNMVGEGLIDPDTAITAMIDKTGEAFEEAQRRVSQQGLVKYAGAVIAADLMPEGEMIQRGLQQELAKAYDAKAAGDKDAVNKFYDKYPEYEARLAIFKDPEEKLRAHLRSKIWDAYLNLPSAQKKIFRQEAGDDFTELFLDQETRSYDSITTDTLALWAQSLVEKAGGQLPEAAGEAKLDVDWLADETAQAIQKYYDERERLFGEYDPDKPPDENYTRWQNAYLAEHPAIIPYVIGEENKLYGLPPDIQTYVYAYRAQRDARFPNIFDTQDRYFTMNKNERKAFLQQHPELTEYWDWRKQMAAAFPKAAAYILSEESLAAEILDDDYVTYSGGGGYSGGGSGSPTYTSTGKPATGYHPPYLTSSELKMFSRALIMQLMAKFYRNERLLPGANAEINRIWEQLGRPFGTLEDFIEFAVKPTLTQ